MSCSPSIEQKYTSTSFSSIDANISLNTSCNSTNSNTAPGTPSVDTADSLNLMIKTNDSKSVMNNEADQNENEEEENSNAKTLRHGSENDVSASMKYETIPTTTATTTTIVTASGGLETAVEATTSTGSLDAAQESSVAESKGLTQLLSTNLSLKTQRCDARNDAVVTASIESTTTTATAALTTSVTAAAIEIFTDTPDSFNTDKEAREIDEDKTDELSFSTVSSISGNATWSSSLASTLQNSLGGIATGLAEQDLIAKINDNADCVILRGSASQDGDRQKNSSRLSVRAKKKSWYNVLYPNYKSRADDFKKLFKAVPNEERLIVDYSCALQRELLLQGRMYVSQNYVCFHANIFRWETYLSIKWEDVTSITKEKTALVIPNAISICTAKEKFFFATFTSRDKAFLMLFRIWQNTLMKKTILPQEIWQWVHNCYGEELGLTTDDEDYIDPTSIQCGDNDTDADFLSASDDVYVNLEAYNINSSNSNQSINQIASCSNHPNSGNSSASSGGGSDTHTAGSVDRPKKTKYSIQINTNNSQQTSSNSSSDNKTSSSDMKSDAKEDIDNNAQLKYVQVNNAAIANLDKGNLSSRETKCNIFDGKRKVTKNSRQRDENLSKNSETLPTDMSASSDSDNDKIPFVATTACNSTHEGRQIVHTILPINIDTLFNILFSKSKFMQEFHAMRRTENIVFGDWIANKDGTQSRTVSLTVQVSASVGPKTSRVTEDQLMRDCSKPSELYSIDVITTNAGIPYADSFCVMMHFCLVRTADDNTMFSMHAQIKYLKSIWGFVRGVIEKNTWAGVEEFYSALLQALQTETNVPPAKGKGRRPRRGNATPARPKEETNTNVTVKTDGSVDTSSISAQTNKPPHLPASVQFCADEQTHSYRWLSLCVIALLLFLIVLNVILLQKLWQLEQRIEQDVNSHIQLPNWSQLKELPNTNEEWVRLLREQEILHERELKKWHTVLQTAIELLKKTEKTLAVLMFQYQ